MGGCRCYEGGEGLRGARRKGWGHLFCLQRIASAEEFGVCGLEFEVCVRACKCVHEKGSEGM
jgi:hypothetical protein